MSANRAFAVCLFVLCFSTLKVAAYDALNVRRGNWVAAPPVPSYRFADNFLRQHISTRHNALHHSVLPLLRSPPPHGVLPLYVLPHLANPVFFGNEGTPTALRPKRGGVVPRHELASPVSVGASAVTLDNSVTEAAVSRHRDDFVRGVLAAYVNPTD